MLRAGLGYQIGGGIGLADQLGLAHPNVLPIYDVADIMADPQVVARESVTELPDPELGSVKMQNVMFRMLGTPAELRWAGRPVGGDNEEVYGEVGIDPQRLAQLHAEGVV